MEIVFAFLFFAATVVESYRNRRQYKVGSIAGKKQKYGYSMGNFLISEQATFHGLDITLPYTLTNFYLDSHKDSKYKGPALLFDPSQKLALEGTFNRSFQLFIPKGSGVLALSVLSPDVMQTLITSSGRFDVELYDYHLRIMTPKKVYGTEMEAALLTAAKALLKELDHRAGSWQPQKELPAKLQYRKGATLKLAGRYLRRSRLIAALSVLLGGILASGLVLSYYYTLQDQSFSDPFSKGWLAGVLMYAAAGMAIIGAMAAVIGPLAWFLWKNKSPKDIFPTQPTKKL